MELHGTPNNKLVERGIAEPTQRYGWGSYTYQNRPGWSFPVSYPGGTARRWKAADGQKPKNKWIPGQPDNCKYYIPHGEDALRAAIEQADGTVWFANGEPSLLAHLAADIENVICWFGEGSVPHSLAADLLQWGVREVRHPADKDEAGRKGAVKVRAQLKDSGIVYKPLQWGDDAGEHYDANDAWIAAGFDAWAFIDALHDLQPLLLPADEKPVRTPARKAHNGVSLKKADAIAEVIRRVEGRTHKNGDYVNFCCPLHEEHEPSAGINTKTGSFTCFGGCGSLSLEEVCERLGIDYQRYQPTRMGGNAALPPVDQSASHHGNAKEPRSQYFHADGLPDTWLRAFCKIFHGSKNAPKVARLWFEGLRAGLLDPQDVTLAALCHARDVLHIPLTESAIRDFMNEYGELFGYLNKSFSACSNTQIIRRGPSGKHYTARTLAEIEYTIDRRAACRFDELRHIERGTTPNLDAQKADALDGDTRRAALEILREQPPPSEQARVSSWLARKHTGELARELKVLTPTTIPLETDDIRAALRAQDHTDDDQRSYGKLGRDYGMSKASARKLNARAGLAPVAQVVNCPIRGSAERFDQEVREVCKRESGFPLALVEITADGKRIEHDFQTADPEGNRDVYAAVQARGGGVELAMRQANKYRRLDPDEQAQPATSSTPKVAFRRTNPTNRREIRPYYGDGYNPSIVRMWLITHLRRLKWQESGGWFTSPATGEKFDLREKELLEFATDFLGAEVKELA